ncbi:MAG: Zn-ribbon domain-containing OB-fold protein [Promethearchaeia archaeon]
MSNDKVIVTNRGLVRAEFNFYVGKWQDRMLDQFENKKLIGNQCPECKDVFLPPRKICGKCHTKIPLEENWVDLPNIGTLENYTITPYKINDRGARTVRSERIIGMVQIDGASTCIVYELLDMEPEDVEIGMKLEVKWTKKPKGSPTDIKGFVKVRGGS